MKVGPVSARKARRGVFSLTCGAAASARPGEIADDLAEFESSELFQPIPAVQRGRRNLALPDSSDQELPRSGSMRQIQYVLEHFVRCIAEFAE